MKTMNHAEYMKRVKTMTYNELLYTARDAKEAAAANPEGENTSYYLDEVRSVEKDATTATVWFAYQWSLWNPETEVDDLTSDTASFYFTPDEVSPHGWSVTGYENFDFWFGCS